MISPYHLQSRDVAAALTDFSVAFDSALALGEVEQWASSLGYVVSSNAIRTTFPIPVSAAGYRARRGDDVMRRLYERSLSMSPVEWQDGVEELARLVRAPDFMGWGSAPADMAFEALRFDNVLAADVLQRNPLLDFYREEFPGGSVASTIHLFAATHPFNVLDASVGTFANDWSAGDTVEGETVPAEVNRVLIKQLRQHFRSVNGPNGRPLGLRLAALMVTADHEEEARDLLERAGIAVAQTNVAGTQNVGGVVLENRYKGLRLIVADELTGSLPGGGTGDVDTIYGIASKAAGLTPPPIVLQDAGSEEIVYDESSEKYKNEGKIGVKRVLTRACAAALPHAIVRVNLSP
ncbi:MAG: hypothetical protein A2Y78_00235 [Acidobacteria bacterium RBG_13_68_16]|nr:MAG: hypothetical protein A2Y78_00235 [Acidobacteria bacterium RBG_13_68_16]